MIRSEIEADAEQIGRVVEAAFGEPAEARLVEALRASKDFIEDLSLVALSSDGVGHGMVPRAPVDDGADRFAVGNLSPLSVAPDHQRRGIGTALVREVLRRADERDLPLVILEGDPSYYGRLGFEWSVPFGIEITLPSWAPPEAAQVFRLRSYDPAIRGRVAYPAAFDLVKED